MKILLVEPEGPGAGRNLAILKLARWAEDRNHVIEHVIGKKNPTIKKPDKIFMSLMFSYHSSRYERTIDHYLKMFKNAELHIGGVFPSLNAKWFESKSKWRGRIKIHKGQCSWFNSEIPKYNWKRRFNFLPKSPE